MTHFNKSSLPLFDDLLQALERKLRYCRRSFDCGFFEDHTSLEQQALLSGRKIEIFFPKIFGSEKLVTSIRASIRKPICREDFAKPEHSGKLSGAPVTRAPNGSIRYLSNLAFNPFSNRHFAATQASCEEAQGLVAEIGDGIQKTSRRVGYSFRTQWERTYITGPIAPQDPRGWNRHSH